jgi:hypothetical protein
MNVVSTYSVLALVAIGLADASAQSRSNTASEVKSSPELVIRTIAIDFGSPRETVETLEALQLTSGISVTAQPATDVLILRGGKEEVETTLRTIEQLQRELKEKALASQERSFSIRVPLKSKLTWTGGEGGLTTTPFTGPNLHVKPESITSLRLSQIEEFPGMIVAIEARTAAWDFRTANALKVMPVVQITDEDLTHLSDGLSVTKTITGPHELSIEHPDLFETIIIQTGDDEVTSHQSHQDYVALFCLKSIRLPISVSQSRAPMSSASNSGPVNVPQAVAETHAVDVQQVFEQLQLAYKNKLPTDTINNLEEKLRQKVTLEFENRQRVQLGEIQAQRNKLDSIQQRIQARTAQAGSIVDRRFKQLQQQARE